MEDCVDTTPSTGVDGAATTRGSHPLARSSPVLQHVTLPKLPITVRADAAARQTAVPSDHDQFHQSGYCWAPRSVRVVLNMDAATCSSVAYVPCGIARGSRVSGLHWPLPTTAGAGALSEVAARRRHVERGNPVDAARDGDGDGHREQHFTVVYGYRRFFALLLAL